MEDAQFLLCLSSSHMIGICTSCENARHSARQKAEDDQKATEGKFQQLQPPPPRRRLTLPYFFPQHNAQLQSLFVSRLPPELRHQVYQTILGGQTFHIWRLSANKGSSERQRGLCRRHCASKATAYPYRLRIARGCPCYYSKESAIFNYPLSALPFLQSCRRIYSEAVDVLYTGNVIEILEHASIDFDLKASMPLHRFNSIRHLRLGRDLYDWDNSTGQTSNHVSDRGFWTAWEQTWVVVASMEGLVTLEVGIYHQTPQLMLDVRERRLWEERIMEPLWMVKRPKKWVVDVNWRETGLELQGAPFNVMHRI